ncbi:MAG: dTMP kinase [Clostridiales bacterium]|nr:dTMP kinase [Clostridiales bacterium]
MDSIGVLWGYGSREELEKAKPDYLIQSVGELYDILGVAPEPVSRGYFISLEGNDGCGKSTQAKMLHEWLIRLGYDVVMTREPGGSMVAEKIRELVLDRENTGMQDMTEALLYAASRAQHVRDIILPALAAGKIVLSDRYVDSSIAYQGAGRELGMDLVARINAPAIDGCLPDLTVLLDIDAAAALRRRERASEVDRIEMMEDSFHVRVGKAYQELLKQNPLRIVRVDAQGSEEEVALRVSALVSQRLKDAGLS